ncbi:MAG: inositol 2-dehydrogenase [Anaerolineaceae bacterium]|jgi:myo-inositol 2-dehydrogenase/D-chiro-inositol 1-dehydrogenase
MENQRLKIGIIGAGMIGKVHAENLSYRIPTANPIMIADINESEAHKSAERCHIPQAVKDYHEILSNPQVEAVVICSSTNTHSQIICEAAEAGKHIFCEKPIDFSLQKIDQALKLVKEKGVKLQVGFNRRFDPSFNRVRQAVTGGEIGEPHLIHIVSRDPEPPTPEYVKTSGGIFMDMTIHDFDMARYLVGKEVTEIYAAGGVRIDPEIGKAGDLDTILLLLKYEDGTLGTIDNSEKAAYGYDQRVEIFGSKGAIQISNNYPNSAVVSSSQAIYRDKPLYFFIERYIESYVAELRSFIDAVMNHQQVLVTGKDARMPVVMGLAARRSYDENRPVKLSEI